MSMWPRNKPLVQPPHFRTGEPTIKDGELGQLIDKRRDLAAQVAGLDIQICMAVGDRDAAYRHMREMNAQTEARKAARFAMCWAMEAH